MHIFDFSILVDHKLVQAESHIEDDNLLSAADRGHIPSYFIVSADGNNFYFHVNSSMLVLLFYDIFLNFSPGMVLVSWQCRTCSARSFARGTLENSGPAINQRYPVPIRDISFLPVPGD
jgi:hypothetical protein